MNTQKPNVNSGVNKGLFEILKTKHNGSTAYESLLQTIEGLKAQDQFESAQYQREGEANRYRNHTG